MRKNIHKILTISVILCIACTLPLWSQGSKEKQTGDEKLTVAVSILPHQAAVDRIGGEYINSLVIVGKGQSPHSYDPSPRQMSDLSEADIWLLSGTDFETTIKTKISSLYPRLTIIDGTEGVHFRTLSAHAHDDQDDHAGEKTRDLHTWLGEEPYLLFIDHAASAMIEADPEHAEIYRVNAEDFKAEIRMEFSSLREDLSHASGKNVLVFHPSFGYFLDEFDIEQEAIETGGKEPTARILSQIIAESIADGINTVFVQEQFPASAAQTVASAIGGEVVALDPLAYEWIENIRKLGRALISSFEEE